MADVTVNALTETTAPAANDVVGIWDLAAGQYKKVKVSNLVGATILNGGTLDLGNKTITAPASGTLALIDVAQTYSAEMAVTPGLCSQRNVTINDDAVLAIDVARAGWLLIGSTSGGFGNRHAIVAFRAGSGPYAGIVAQPSTLFETSTAVLTGTTGTDGKITVAATGGKLYVENRSGGNYAFTFLIIQ